MGAQEEGAGLTLEGLAQRLESQTHRLETLERENSELRSKVATLEGSQMPSADEEPARALLDERVSRRRLLSKAGAAAAGLVVAGALTQRDIREAKAAPGAFTSADKSTPAVWAVHHSNGTGVQGESFNDGFGVTGTGRTGVYGNSNVSEHSGVYGQHAGSLGYGIIGDGTGATGAGALGRNVSGSGVRGEGVNGVHGKATSGYGGLFEGGKAQLKIVPKGRVGKPTSGAHTKGEVYMDSAGALFVCTASGTPGTWRKVTTTAA